MFTYNPNIVYKPNRGQWRQKLSTAEIIQPKVVVNTKGDFFRASYQNVFTKFWFHGVTDEDARRWREDPPLEFYVGCLSFAVFCSTSALGISSEDFQQLESYPLGASLLRFHLYYHVCKILYLLNIKLPFQFDFQPKQKVNYDKQGYLNLCREYGVKPDYDWSFTKMYSSMQGSVLMPIREDSWSRWIMETSRGLTKQGVEMLSESIRVYVYCVLTAQTSTGASILGESAPSHEAKKLFVSEMEDFLKLDTLLHEDIQRYEKALNYSKSQVNYSLGAGLYRMPSNLVLKTVSPYHGGTRQLTAVSRSVLTPREQRLSKEHHEEVQSVVVAGSLLVVGIIYFLKRR